MLVPDSVATTVSTAFRRSGPTTLGAHPSAQRSAAVLEAARAAVADLFNVEPAGVVLGADRAILLSALAEASSSRAGLGYEVIVSRLDDEANIAPWLRAAHRYGAKVKWAEIDIETGELPTWQWEGLIGKSTRLVAVASASATLGTVTDLRAMTKLVHDVGGLVVVDHSAAAPYRLLDVKETDADVVAVNAAAWGGPPIGAMVFRDPGLLNSFSSISPDPKATGPGGGGGGAPPGADAGEHRQLVGGMVGRALGQHLAHFLEEAAQHRGLLRVERADQPRPRAAPRLLPAVHEVARFMNYAASWPTAPRRAASPRRPRSCPCRPRRPRPCPYGVRPASVPWPSARGSRRASAAHTSRRT
jgi:hypothetical protein